MDFSPELKEQLMALSGVSDPNEFEKLLEEMAPAINKARQESAAQMAPVTVAANKNCPFQVHMIQMLGTIEAEGLKKFTDLNRNVQAQLQYVFNVFKNDKRYNNVRNLVKKRNKESTGDENPAEKSQKLRAKGNQFYEKRKLGDALEQYNQSILSGPLDTKGQGREVALGLGNRSAVFFEQKKFAKTLDDIEACFIFGYPDELKYKLYERQGRCYLALKDENRARDAFQSALKFIEKSPKLKPNRREKLVEEISDILENLSKLIQDEETVPDKGIKKRGYFPFKIWNRHPNFPSFSDVLQIVFKPNIGRHVIATQSIRAGESVVIEDPIAYHLSPYKMRQKCLHCFRELGESVLPSPHSQRARFCRLACMKEACRTYHPAESVIDINEIFYGDEDGESQLSGCISLAYRAVTQKSLDFFVQNRDSLFSNHDLEFGTDVSKDFSYAGDELYRGLYNLVTHFDSMTSEERMNLMIRTYVLLKCLRESGFFPEETLSQDEGKLTKEELFIGELLFHFQCGIKYNLHTIYHVDDKIEAAKKILMVDIGSGVYPTTLFFNHSCCPNTVRINMGPQVAYVAKRNIKAGEEVTDCYGIHHMSLDLETRRKTLRIGYAFDCKCEACTNDYPMFAYLPAEISPQIALKLGNTLSRYKKLFDQGKFEQALKACQEYLLKLEDYGVKYPHRNFEVAALALCSCLWAMVKDY